VTGRLAGGEAERLVTCAYGALDLFAGRPADLLAWAQGLTSERSAADLAPEWWADATRAALLEHLHSAGVTGEDGGVDPYRLALFQQVVELLPHFQAAERARVPAPKPRVVFTVPPGVALPERARDFQRRSLAARVLTALSSADERTLLASPFWSDAGAENLWDGLERSVELGLPITLMGARQDPERGDLDAMLRLARRLKDAGAKVTALRYRPPPGLTYSLCHSKVVCGRKGYLGSANLTDSGLGVHVEAGLPLDEVDVGQVWWLVDVLRDTGLLEPCTL
jgi:phosphatidylserine/phosphatidylglycerophosphate/cardiolipin synthase-like enzyme